MRMMSKMGLSTRRIGNRQSVLGRPTTVITANGSVDTTEVTFFLKEMDMFVPVQLENTWRSGKCGFEGHIASGKIRFRQVARGQKHPLTQHWTSDAAKHFAGMSLEASDEEDELPRQPDREGAWLRRGVQYI